MASAISRTILSLTWLRNLFQLFQPIGGVLASPLAFTGAGIASLTGGAGGGKGSGGAADARVSSITWGWPPRPPPGGRLPRGGPPAPGGPPGPGPRPGPPGPRPGPPG